MPVHSDGLVVAKKFNILEPLVAITCDRSLVVINTSIQLSVAVNPVGCYRFIATSLTTTYTSVAIITTYSDQFGVAIDWLWYSDLFGIVSVANCIDSLACIGYM